MPFLPDVVAPCEACGGVALRAVDARGALRRALDRRRAPPPGARTRRSVFANHRQIARPLATLADLGVGYVQIGQGSNTLSGGEAQRLKLAAELTAGAAHEPTVYVLDEPTTGLHLSDVRRLLGVLERLVERGDTLVVIEHHPDVIASADWVVELGPEAGEDGGGSSSRASRAKLARAQDRDRDAISRNRRAADGLCLAAHDAAMPRTLVVDNPFTGARPPATVPLADDADVDATLDRARAAAQALAGERARRPHRPLRARRRARWRRTPRRSRADITRMMGKPARAGDAAR